MDDCGWKLERDEDDKLIASLANYCRIEQRKKFTITLTFSQDRDSNKLRFSHEFIYTVQ